MKRIIFFVSLSALALGAAPVAAQQGQTQQDSILVQLRQLLRRVDSLERIINQLRAAGRDTAGPTDELAALRAAAREAAGPEAERADSVTPQSSRTRNLNILNPEISVSGDVVGNYTAPGGGANRTSGTPREFEFSFQSALDPYTRTKIFVTREEDFEIAGFPEEEEEEEGGHGGFEIEEGYMYWVGLPGGLGAKVGKFRQEIGLYNRWHTHALFEVERPLAATTFLGEDGLIQTGVGVTLPNLTLGPTTWIATFEATRGDNEVLFEDAGDLSYLGRVQSFFDLGSSYFQLGATGVLGENADQLDSRLLGLDAFFRWIPPGRALYRDVQLKAEWYLAEKETPLETLTGNGGYFQANFRANRRWILGTRADFVNGFGPAPDIVQLAPSLSWWQSEWVRLRLQYNYLRPEGGPDNHTMLLQFVWAIGPHKHETY